jgi:hypothetical protein
MKERTKKRIWEFIGGSFLLGVGFGDWLLLAKENYYYPSLQLQGGLLSFLNQNWLALFYLFHIGAIVIGASTIYMAFRPEKYVVRVCPKCQTDTQQFESDHKVFKRLREWTCEKCHTKNMEQLPPLGNRP